MDKVSYALGLSMGHNFLGTGIKNLNVEEFAKGVKAVYDGAKPEMSLDEAKNLVNEYFEKLQKEMLDINKKAGIAYLEEYAQQPEVIVMPSGLEYKVLKQGEGKTPKATDKVRVHYTGKTIDGKVFDSSEQRGVPAEFGVNQVIPGWVEALQLMPEGSKWQLVIPSDLAYGEHGAGDAIAPNSTLIFDVELLKVL
ncbi:MAG: FKBP-type peptidyl-prolyl cis-trans isomerase [Bacteroidales bacterium]|nr:FKBP-type peptidyl-prolyl cis-trans isomerase [Bacteroidales bacterium]